MSTNWNSSEQAVVITDDDAALEIIMGLGVFDKVSKAVALGQRTTVFHKISWHTKFWILVGRYHGFEQTAENGWLVAMWPKSKFAATEMDRYIVTTARDVREVIDLERSEENN